MPNSQQRPCCVAVARRGWSGDWGWTRNSTTPDAPQPVVGISTGNRSRNAVANAGYPLELRRIYADLFIACLAPSRASVSRLASLIGARQPLLPDRRRNAALSIVTRPQRKSWPRTWSDPLGVDTPTRRVCKQTRMGIRIGGTCSKLDGAELLVYNGPGWSNSNSRGAPFVASLDGILRAATA